MTPLRKRMMEDMTLASLTAGTQANYIREVRRLAAHYRRSPEELSEAEVRRYLLTMRERGVAEGTVKVCHYGIQFLYRETLDRPWPLFTKKRFAGPSGSGCRTPSLMPKQGGCWPRCAARSTRTAFL